MHTVGIICECNPFHGGHEYLIRQARKSGAEAVICVMSGYFVQRGEPSISPAHLRAEALLCGGADAVLELPFPYCAASAEFFAAAGVEILSRLGVSELWFGSECGDLSLLSRLANTADEEEFLAYYAKSVQGNDGSTAAYLDALQAFSKLETSLGSNDILGISYLRALRRMHSPMSPVTLKREGATYRQECLHGEEYPSATALRRLWKERGLPSVLPYLPVPVAKLYQNHPTEAPADLLYAERWILGHFRMTPAHELEAIAELGGGLGYRLAQCAKDASSLDELLLLSATKKYTNARLRRGILFALTGNTPEDLRTSPAYARLLAATEVGCGFLAACRRSASIPVVTRRADLPNTPDALRQAELERRAYSLYTLCLPSAKNETELWKTSAVIRKDIRHRNKNQKMGIDKA